MHTNLNPRLASLATEFLRDPSEELEQAIVLELNNQLASEGFSKIEDLSIEWDCTEHGVIYLFGHEGQPWLEIDPVDGRVSNL